jgi:hypothetical protein
MISLKAYVSMTSTASGRLQPRREQIQVNESLANEAASASLSMLVQFRNEKTNLFYGQTLAVHVNVPNEAVGLTGPPR